MTETKEHVPSEVPEPKRSGTGGGYKGLVFGAALLVSVGAMVAGFYGIRSGALLIKALALNGALVSAAAWLALHAARIRQRIRDAQDWEPGAWVDAGDEGIDASVALQDAHHARTIHFAVLAAPAAVIIGLVAIWLLRSHTGVKAEWVPEAGTAAASVICLVACCLWLVLSKSFEAAHEEDLPEAPALMLAFRDLQWTTLLAAAGILGTFVWPEEGLPGWAPPEIWVARLLLAWIVAVSVEQLLRIGVAWLRRAPLEEGFASPVRLLLREAVFVRGNPIASMFETIEARFGVSFRSSWAIRFVRAAAIPSLAAVLLMFWGLTCLSVVGTSELGVRESFGRIQAVPLQPGLHWKLPLPFGRVLHYPVKEVFTKPIGFLPIAARQQSYLWSKEHATEEFNLVTGDATEAVAVNAMVYYKICEDTDRFLDYVYWWMDPENVEQALDAYAHRVLMEQTRSATLAEVLATNRAEFANHIRERLQEYSEENRLGIDVIDVAILNVHPPIEVAADYLDVISAGIDAKRYQIEAEGQAKVALEKAEWQSITEVAGAQVEAAEAIGKASEGSAEFVAIGQAYSVAPEAFKLRLRFEALEEALADKELIVVDETFARGPGGVSIDLRSGRQNRQVVPSGVE